MKKIHDKPIVSIIIPTYNSERTLEKCINSIENQDYDGTIEIIIIDNFSIDNTKIITNKFRTKFIEEKSGMSKARNIGAKQVNGKYILNLDSDMYLSSRVISECVNMLETDRAKIALYIPEKIIGKGFWIKIRNFEREFYNSTCIDAIRFVRTEIFREIKGFDESLLGGEDWDFDRRIKKKGLTDIINSHLCHDEGKFTISNYLNKKKSYTGTLDRYVKKWGEKDAIVKKQLGVEYRLFGVFIENGNWKRLIVHPILSICMSMLRFMVGFQYLKENIVCILNIKR